MLRVNRPNTISAGDRVWLVPSHREDSSNTMEPLQSTPSEQAGNTSTVRAPPVEFKAVSPSVHVHHPSPKVKAADTQGILAPIRPKNAALSPNIILIMGWMNAPLRLVSKYAAPYALLFPAATIIVQLSTGVTFIQKKKAHEQSFKHVINLLQDINTSEKAKSDMHDNIRSLQDGPQQSELTLDSDSQKGLKKLPDETNSSKANPQPKQAGLLIHSCEYLRRRIMTPHSHLDASFRWRGI